MSRFVRALVCAVFAIGVTLPAFAAEPKGTFRANLGYLSPTGDLKERIGFDTGEGVIDVDIKAEFDSALGVALGYEYRFNDLIGLDVGLQYYKPKVKFEGRGGSVEVRDDDSGKFMPLTVGPMFHVAKTDKIDFYLGPELAYVLYGGVDLETAGKVDFKNDLVVGAKLGANVLFSGDWALNFNLEYLAAKAKTDQPDADNVKLNAKPLILTVGAAYRF